MEAYNANAQILGNKMKKEEQNSSIQKLKIERCVKELFKALGVKLIDGVKDTPQRVANFYYEQFSKPQLNLTTFPANGYNQMIIVQNIKFYTLCEHHLLPFFGKVAIGYIPNEKILGFSKFARVVDYFSKGLNTQEYFTQNIADYLFDILNPQGLGVIVFARHLCAEMRGVKKSGIWQTIALKGTFYKKRVKNEFLGQIKKVSV